MKFNLNKENYVSIIEELFNSKEKITLILDINDYTYEINIDIFFNYEIFFTCYENIIMNINFKYNFITESFNYFKLSNHPEIILFKNFLLKHIFFDKFNNKLFIDSTTERYIYD